MNNITFVIFTFNEENRIENVIKNFKNYGNILIADNQSTDKTQEIARKHDCEVLIRTEEFEFVENQAMMDHLSDIISTDWIYWGFADEMLDKETIEEILRVISLKKYDIISIDRKNYFYGKFCHNAFASRTNKIFRNGSISFLNNIIHGFGVPTVEPKKIHHLPDRYFVHHFISNTAQSYLNTINRYTETELKFHHQSRSLIFTFIFLPAKMFITNFFLKKGYKAGFHGWSLSQLMIIYFLVKHIKLLEQKHNISAISIENKNNIIREKILRTLQ